jgi:hypothetical protein
MNDVSIIINGVRYDAIDTNQNDITCKGCELPITICDSCSNLLNDNQVFKKSNKSFEK